MIAPLLTALVTGAVLAAGTSEPPSAFQSLPLDIQSNILLRTPDCWQQLSDTCCYLRHGLSPALRVQTLLLHPFSIPDSELANEIRFWVDCVANQNRFVLRDLTPQSALGLYDRLMASTLSAQDITHLLNVLINHVDGNIFMNVVSAFGTASVKSATIISGLDSFNLGPEPVGIPEPILDKIDALRISDAEVRNTLISADLIAAVRSRYPPRFNFFPNNHIIADRLLSSLNQHEITLLCDEQVVLALLRYGVRFNFDYFYNVGWILRTNNLEPCLDTLLRISPLLAPILPGSPFNDCLSIMRTQPDSTSAAALIQTPLFQARVRQHPEAFVRVLISVYLYEAENLSKVILRQPFMSDIIHVNYDGDTIMDYVLKGPEKIFRPLWVGFLQHVPGYYLSRQHLRHAVYPFALTMLRLYLAVIVAKEIPYTKPFMMILICMFLFAFFKNLLKPFFCRNPNNLC